MNTERWKFTAIISLSVIAIMAWTSVSYGDVVCGGFPTDIWELNLIAIEEDGESHMPVEYDNLEFHVMEETDFRGVTFHTVEKIEGETIGSESMRFVVAPD